MKFGKPTSDKEWPKTFFAEHEPERSDTPGDIVFERTVPVVPAALARELYEALKHSDDETNFGFSTEVQEVLDRYETEVGK